MPRLTGVHRPVGPQQTAPARPKALFLERCFQRRSLTSRVITLSTLVGAAEASAATDLADNVGFRDNTTMSLSPLHNDEIGVGL